MDAAIPQEFLDHAAEARVSPTVKLGMNRAALHRLAQFPEAERLAILRAWRAQLQAGDGRKQAQPAAVSEPPRRKRAAAPGPDAPVMEGFGR